MIPGEMNVAAGDIELNKGRKTVTLQIMNSGSGKIVCRFAQQQHRDDHCGCRSDSDADRHAPTERQHAGALHVK